MGGFLFTKRIISHSEERVANIALKYYFMRVRNFKVPLYMYTVTVVFMDGDDDVERLHAICKHHYMEEEDIPKAIEEATCGYNGGITYRHMGMKDFLVIIYQCDTRTIRRSVVNHEKRHVEDRILEACGVKDIEAAGYLAGFLSTKMY